MRGYIPPEPDPGPLTPNLKGTNMDKEDFINLINMALAANGQPDRAFVLITFGDHGASCYHTCKPTQVIAACKGVADQLALDLANAPIDEQLINRVTSGLAARFREKAEEGRAGWDTCEVSHLENLLGRQLAKPERDYIDIMALAAMLWWRQANG